MAFGIGSYVIKTCVKCGAKHKAILRSRLVASISPDRPYEDSLYRDEFCDCPESKEYTIE